MRPQLTLTQYILLGLGLSLVIGLVFPQVGSALSILSVIFIRLLQMMVVPFVFSTLVAGVAGAKGGSSLKRLAIRTVVFFLIATTIAALFGMAGANRFKPGVQKGVALDLGAEAAPLSERPRPSIIGTMIPTSIFQAMHGNNLVAVVLFTVAFGLALRSVGRKGAHPQGMRVPCRDHVPAYRVRHVGGSPGSLGRHGSHGGPYRLRGPGTFYRSAIYRLLDGDPLRFGLLYGRQPGRGVFSNSVFPIDE
jgi:hypothetical protein